MNKMRTRALEHFPSVLLTLVSIIQALALELLWSKINSSDFLWTLDQQSLIGWGMASVVLLGIVQIWVWYSFMVMGFSWLPSLRDSIFPFVIGIQEFTMIALIDHEFRGLWLYVLASIFITANWVTHTSFRRARNEPDNDLFFDTRKPATLRDFKYAIAITMTLIFSGLLIDIFPQQTLLPLIVLVFANLALIFQIKNSRNVWITIMNLGEEDGENLEKIGSKENLPESNNGVASNETD